MDLSHDTFKPLEGQVFTLIGQGGTALDVTLAQVEAGKLRASIPATLPGGGVPREPFSLFFEGTQHYYCPQGTYRLRHATLGEIELFLVPVEGLPDDRYRYQAAFS